MFAILLSLVVTVATAGESSLNIPGVNTTYLLDVWITRPHMAFRVLQYQYPALTYPPRFLSVEPEGQNALTCSSSRFMCDLHCLLIGPDGRTFAGVKGIKSEELQNSTAVIPTFTQSGATQVNCTLVFHHPDNSSIVDEIKNVVYLTAFKGSCEDAPDVSGYLECRSRMGGSVSSIIPGVYVGGISSAKSEKELDGAQVTHICSFFQVKLNLNHKRVHKQFLINDSPDEDISKFFTDAIDFIHGARVNHGNVLIHCACGISRSVSATIAYLLVATDFNLKEIYKAMRAARPGASPNEGFLRQLKRFEESGEYLRTRAFIVGKYGPWPVEKAQADREAIEKHIAAQETFIRTGYYPWEVGPPEEKEGGEEEAGVSDRRSSRQKRNESYMYRLPDGFNTLDEALAAGGAKESSASGPSDQ